MTILDQVATHLQNASSDVWDYAQLIRDCFESQQGAQARQTIMERLGDIGREDPSPGDLACFTQHIKAMLGLGILVACQRDAPQQRQDVRDSLLAILENEQKYSSCCRRMALSELTYVDQFLRCDAGLDVRGDVYADIKTKCRRDPWSSAITDFNLNRAESKRRSDVQKQLGPNTAEGKEALRDSLDVYVVCSVKGGVGKSLTASALLCLKALCEGEKTLLIDADMAGPTAQYYFDIPECSAALGVVPLVDPLPRGRRSGVESERTSSRHSRQAGKSDGTSDSEGELSWCYPSLFDLVRTGNLATDLEPEEGYLRSAAEQAIMPIAGHEEVAAAVVLPDSPSFVHQVSARVATPMGYYRLCVAIRALLMAARDKGYRNAIIDLGPGLTGPNGALLRYLGEIYSTRVVLLSTPRASDLATSVYEGTWAAADGEYSIKKPILHLINMCHNGAATAFKEAMEERLRNWTKWAIGKALEASVKQDWGAATSAEHIFYWRMWSYLYLKAVPHSEEMIYQACLPFCPNLANILDPPLEQGQRLRLDEGRLMDQKSQWWIALKDAVKDAWGGSHEPEAA